MDANGTHAQRRGPSAIATSIVAVVAIAACLFGAWTWWLRPRRAAAERAREQPLVDARATAERALAARGVATQLGDEGEAILRWRPPSSCVEVYRLRVDERFRDASVAVFVGHEETHASWTLALAPVSATTLKSGLTSGSKRRAALGVDGLLVPDAAPGDARWRRLWWSPEAVGPAAPDLACRRRGWDPLEDALALGWPELPGQLARIGDRWRGASVEGRCHETACVDDRGQFSHAAPCRARPWTEQLAGAGDGVALVVGSWDDGHDPARPEIGILTSREALIHDGRPLRVHATVEHRWSGVSRELELWRIDDCSALSLAAPEDRSAVEQIRARLRQPPGE